MNYTARDHCFVVCAYGESPYLEECIRSLLRQTVRSHIAVSTSTPRESIRALAEKYDLPLFVREGEPGMADDWNFAVSCAETELVTLAHQDDIYEPAYTETMLRTMNRSAAPILFCCAYGELRQGRKVYENRLLNIKKLLCLPMRAAPWSRLARRMTLALGDPICCPSVTLRREIALRFPFGSEYRCDLDWQEWEKLSRLPGSFAFSPAPLVCHRIHEDSETSRILGMNARRAEDYAMFCQFWPKSVAKVLTTLYSGSEKSNRLG